MNQNFLGKTDRILGISLRGIGSFAVVVLWIIVTATVLFRIIPIFSMGWSDEIVELLFAWMVFICSAELGRQKKHFIVDLIPNMITGTRTGHILNIVIQVLALAFLLVFTYQGVKLTTLATDRSPYFELPKWLWYLCIPVAGLIMTGYTIRNLYFLIWRGRHT